MSNRINLNSVYNSSSYLEQETDNDWKLHTDARAIIFHDNQLEISGTQALVLGDTVKGYLIEDIKQNTENDYILKLSLFS